MSHAHSGPARAPLAGLPIGASFADRYEVLAFLGRGGMGSVYKVRDLMVGETVALKTLDLDQADPEVVDRFRREVRLARRITHPHVARTHDLGVYDGTHYLTMELVEGGSLTDLVAREGPLAAPRVCKIGASIAEGLGAAHEADVVHRDLKPDNILFDGTGRLVVTDFGVARFVSEAQARVSGGVAGTPFYMAPEQLSAGPIDGRADLYALGVVLFEMLTRELPFQGQSAVQVALKRLYEEPRDLRGYDGVPRMLADYVMTLLRREPGERPTTAQEVAESLRQLARTIVAPSSSDDAGAAGSLPSLPEIVSVRPSSSSSGSISRPIPLTSGGDDASMTIVGMPSTSIAPQTPRTIVVLPFSYRGPTGDEHLGPALTDELIDVLARTRGLRVVGRGALAQMAGSRDPRTLSKELGADYFVEGTVQTDGKRLRVTVRLVDASDGSQLGGDRVDTTLEDLFETQERVALEIAEALRVELHSRTHERVPREAVDLFLRARQRVRTPALSDVEASVQMLEQCIGLAPQFAPAIALHAQACIRAWFIPGAQTHRDWAAEAARSVERALLHAGHLAESHFAAAQLALQHGELRNAALEAKESIAIAPGFPDAQLFLGSLEVEAGRAMQGLPRIELAVEIEPTLLGAHVELARYHGMYGDRARFEEALARVQAAQPEGILVAQLLVRVGAYRRDVAWIRRGVELAERLRHPLSLPMSRYGREMLGELEIDATYRTVEWIHKASPRIQTLARQMLAEAAGARGVLDVCAMHFAAAAQHVLTDLDWCDRSPFLSGIRDRSEFIEGRKLVTTRCEEIWAI
ncbi:MAG: FlgO family outer membrane protein [Sandaracinus sp.]